MYKSKLTLLLYWAHHQLVKSEDLKIGLKKKVSQIHEHAR